MSETAGTWNNAPAWIRDLVEPNLAVGEAALTWFEPDLDRSLQYTPGLVVLTGRRVLSFRWKAREPRNGTPPQAMESWEIGARSAMRMKEQAGVGTLEMRDGGRLVASWRFTAARATGARRVAEQLEGVARGVPVKASGERKRRVEALCEVCGAVLHEGDASCRECGVSQLKRPVRSLFRLFTVARKHTGMVVLGFVLTLASTASGLIPPYLTMPLFDRILVPYQEGRAVDITLVKWYLLGLLGASVLAWGLTWAQTYVLSWVSERVAADLRQLTYAHLQRLSLEYFGGKRTGDLISRISSDTDRICYFLSVYVLDFFTDLILLLMTAAILISIDVNLAAITLLPMPVIAFLVFRVQERLARGFSQGNRAWAEMTSVLADTIPGIRVVKAFAQEDREIERFQRANERVLHTNDRVNRLWAYFNAVVVLLTDLGVLVVWMFGVWRVFHHSVSVGVLTAFVAYISRFYARLDSMSRMASATQRAAASAQRVFGVLDRAPKVAEARDAKDPGRLEGAIEIRNVGFRYGARPILKDIQLSIRPGEMIGLVGRSGAGKTTLINLLCRFYDVTSGAILVDGTDIRRYKIGQYRRNLGLVLQEPFLFYGTVADNIAYGRPDAKLEEIVAAARAAHAHEFILRLPNGYDSLVGERGQLLSGGERQRISIARALLIDPRILILDEATSSVDTETEREIQLALANLTRGRTTIVIAHRLSTLQRADRLVVLERGRVVEMGAHEELLARGGAYARFHQAQADMQAGRLEEPADEEDDELAVEVEEE
jgi:ATP-binding cassette subfamily B protein